MASLEGEPFWEGDGGGVQCLLPAVLAGAEVTAVFGAHAPHFEAAQLDRGVVVGEVVAVLGHLAQPGVHALDLVRHKDHAAVPTGKSRNGINSFHDRGHAAITPGYSRPHAAAKAANAVSAAVRDGVAWIGFIDARIRWTRQFWTVTSCRIVAAALGSADRPRWGYGRAQADARAYG